MRNAASFSKRANQPAGNDISFGFRWFRSWLVPQNRQIKYALALLTEEAPFFRYSVLSELQAIPAMVVIAVIAVVAVVAVTDTIPAMLTQQVQSHPP